MTLLQFRDSFRNQLNALYPQSEIDDIFKRSILYLFDWSATKIGLEPHYKLSEKEGEQINAFLVRLQKAEPLQYIMGNVRFYEMELIVNPDVLIPRPETEELVSWILAEHSAEATQVLDCCTGSGAIALALKKERPLWTIQGFDVSKKALDIARKNAAHTRLNVNFYEHDVFLDLTDTEEIKLIVANPPYVLPSEKKMMHANVLKHEPNIALFVPEEDPLLFYRSILKLATANKTKNTQVYFEINPLQMNQLVALGKEFGYGAFDVKKDLFGKERFLKFGL